MVTVLLAWSCRVAGRNGWATIENCAALIAMVLNATAETVAFVD